MSNDQLTANYVERPDCKHMQIIMARPALNLSDYNARLVPELREALNLPCEECEKEKAELAKQKLAQEMEDKAGRK
jgi:hypothetical protein